MKPIEIIHKTLGGLAIAVIIAAFAYNLLIRVTNPDAAMSELILTHSREYIILAIVAGCLVAAWLETGYRRW